MKRFIALGAILALGFFAAETKAETYNLPVAFDRWMYPFSITPGNRSVGSTFGAPGEVDFDDRDAQVLIGFDTSSIGGLGASEVVSSAVVTLTISGDNAFQYDPTYDDYTSYPGSDADTGRPVELYGVGTRGGYTGLTLDDNSVDPALFRENSAFGSSSSTYKSTRYAYASDYDQGTARDVSEQPGRCVRPQRLGRGTDRLAQSRCFGAHGQHDDIHAGFGEQQRARLFDQRGERR